MGLKGNNNRFTIVLLSLLLHLPKDRLMPKMDPIEITQRNYRIIEGSF
jgi:hypothetical protein